MSGPTILLHEGLIRSLKGIVDSMRGMLTLWEKWLDVKKCSKLENGR